MNRMKANTAPTLTGWKVRYQDSWSGDVNLLGRKASPATPGDRPYRSRTD